MRYSTETCYTVQDKFLMNCGILKCQAKLSLLHREVNLIMAQRVSQEHWNERSQIELHRDAVLTLLYFSSSNISVALGVTEVQNVSVVKCPDVRARKDIIKIIGQPVFFMVPFNGTEEKTFSDKTVRLYMPQTFPCTGGFYLGGKL